MALSWKSDGSTNLFAADTRYRYNIIEANIAPFQGFIYRNTDMVFTWAYQSIGEAKQDLEHRGEKEYFVRPDDPAYVPPTVDPIPQPKPPVEDAEPPVGVESSVSAFDTEVADVQPVDEQEGDAPAPGEQFPGHLVTIYFDSKNEYRWNRKAANGKVISHSAESYKEKRDCEHGLALANQDTNYRIRDLTKVIK